MWAGQDGVAVGGGGSELGLGRGFVLGGRNLECVLLNSGEGCAYDAIVRVPVTHTHTKASAAVGAQEPS